jgi:glycosyltransferase involved in cell wall biosynthesis
MTFDRDLRALYSGLYRVIAVSKPIEHQLAHSVLVRPSALFRVLNGVELPPNTVAPRPNVGKFNIGTVARLTAQKGVDVFLEAIRLAFGHRQDFVATVVGDGEDRQALERQAEGLPVSFVGYSDDIYGWLQNFDIFCLCSRDDALALALLEAIAAGVPAIASDVGDTRWALEDSVIIVRQPSTADKFAESILELLGSEPRRLELRGRGPKLAAERFSADRLASDVIDILIG